MRLFVKLLVMIAIGLGTQGFIQRYGGEIDEAQFGLRCLAARLNGRDNADPELMDAAQSLRDRQLLRIARRSAAASKCATTRPAEVRTASVADELQWSLACPDRVSARGCDAR